MHVRTVAQHTPLGEPHLTRYASSGTPMGLLSAQSALSRVASTSLSAGCDGLGGSWCVVTLLGGVHRLLAPLTGLIPLLA